MPGKQVTELDALPSFADNSLLPVHNGAGLKKGTLSQLANYLGTKFSNPNLLINPDFKINQRGESVYSSGDTAYTVDRWAITSAKVSVNSDSSVTASSLGTLGYFKQREESISYGKHTYSIYVQAITGTVKLFYINKDSIDVELGTLKQGLNVFTSSDDGFKSVFLWIAGGSSVTLKYAKVEQGAVATSFIAPNPADELVKCERYYEKRNWNTKQATIINNIMYVLDEVKEKRVKPTVKHSGNTNVYYNGSAYSIGTRGFEVVTKNQTRFEFNVGVSLGSGKMGTAFLYDINTEIDAEIY